MTRPYRRPQKRQLPLAGVVCGALVVIGAWLVTWWIVPVAALISAVIWWDEERVVVHATWGAVAGWFLLLLIDSVHGRTWALARAAGGALFLPWGLLFPATLLFAAGLAWSTATLAQTVCRRVLN